MGTDAQRIAVVSTSDRGTKKASELISGYMTQDILERWIGEMSAAGVGTEMVMASEWEVRGGPCYYCGRPWKARHISNRFGDITIHEPDCNCFRRCLKSRQWVSVRGKLSLYSREGCGRWLIYEKLAGKDYCTNCGGPMGVPLKPGEKKEEE